MNNVRRLRVIAGPNGSGKSSVYSKIQEKVHMGHYLNPDDLGFALRIHGAIDLSSFHLNPKPDSLRHYLHVNRAFVHRAESAGEPITMHLADAHLKVDSQDRLGYTAALASGYLREQLVASRQSFTFESVLSDPGKLKEIEAAKEAGYRIYLYFVCTQDPDINVSRVANRVVKGGHFVPEELIRKRYARTLENLFPAFMLSDRAYLFDNSGDPMELILEADGHELHLLVDATPAWVEDYLIAPLRQGR